MKALLEDLEKTFAQTLDASAKATEAMMITGDGTDRPQPPTLFEQLKAEIQAALWQAELRGEQKALAFILGQGEGTPVGIVEQPELTQEQDDHEATLD